jgi:GT2 family glycosyltransferase
VSLVQSLNGLASTWPREIVVVEELDEPAPIEGIKYISHPVLNRGIPYARNLSLSYASGQIVVFLDDDCMITAEWLDRILEPFHDKTVAGVQGGVTVPQGTNGIGWAESILGFPGGGIRRVLEAKGTVTETREISTLNCAYRKWVVDKIGQFDERLKLGAEDYILAKQACQLGRCLFVPNASVSHASRGSLIKIWKWFVRRGRAEIGATRIRGSKEYPLRLILRSSVDLKLFVLAIVGFAVEVDLFTSLAAVSFSYAVIQYVRYLRAWKESGAPLRSLFWIPAVKLVMDVAMDWGRIRGLLFG